VARVEVDYRDLLSRYASGVVVVTTRVGGADHAMTANSFTSVSLHPPLVLFCVQKDSRFHAAIREAGSWVVNLLSGEQAPAAQWFAERGRPLTAQMEVVEYERDDEDIARLTGSLGYLRCTTDAMHDAGDHTIVVGRVHALDTGLAARPLIYLQHRLGPA
jgi:flavin reductase (DIM6/NTAB) family NADH-FMN oxidoreductase RutF